MSPFRPCRRALAWALLIPLTVALAGAGRRWPPARGLVNDFAGALSPEENRRLENLLDELRRKTGAEMAVVTADSLDDEDVESAAADLFAQWGIGRQGKDDGVLIFCAVADRAVRIEVGYGLEPVLPDGLCGRIIRERMVPQFRAGRLGEGLYQGAATAAMIVARNAGATLSDEPASLPTDDNPRAQAFIRLGLIIAVLVVLSLLNRFFGRRRGPPGFYGGMYGSGGGFTTGGGFGGGSSGGGFGGFGGGSSGGGGASGRW